MTGQHNAMLPSPPKARKSRRVYDFPIETLLQFANLRQDQAARALGVAPITLKRICQRRKIRWPYRAYKASIRQVSSSTSIAPILTKTSDATRGTTRLPSLREILAASVLSSGCARSSYSWRATMAHGVVDTSMRRAADVMARELPIARPARPPPSLHVHCQPTTLDRCPCTILALPRPAMAAPMPRRLGDITNQVLGYQPVGVSL